MRHGLSSISFAEFERVLRVLNPRLRIYPSRTTRSSMIYIRNAYHPDSGAWGLSEVYGYPSPFHGSFPKYDFYDCEGLPGRGYTTVFKTLVRMGLINRDRLRHFIPQALDPAKGRPQRKVEKDEVPEVPIHALPVRNVGFLRHRKSGRKPATPDEHNLGT